ncbi:MAG TPA: glycoside hydrolase domain-containing protein [Stellaceae bacterium]|nr:glycoside hydrolase domain-containing protein [Stellaceae bacterium]
MKFAVWTAFLPALTIAACQAPPSPPPPVAVVQPKSPEPAQGVDLATDATAVVNEIKERRIDFVARYYRAPDSRWPALSASEARQLSSQGLKIVAVWESHSRDPRNFSYLSGYRDAMVAYMQAKAIAQPAGSAIYFAVDFDARRRSLAAIDDYFQGIRAGLAAAGGGKADYRVGVYGSGAVCDWIKRSGLAQYSWLSNSIAWAGSIEYEDWNIRQGSPLLDLSFSHDSDEAKNEYGAFQLDDSAASGSSGGPFQYVVAQPQPMAAAPSPAALLSSLP